MYNIIFSMLIMRFCESFLFPIAPAPAPKASKAAKAGGKKGKASSQNTPVQQQSVFQLQLFSSFLDLRFCIQFIFFAFVFTDILLKDRFPSILCLIRFFCQIYAHNSLELSWRTCASCLYLLPVVCVRHVYTSAHALS